MPYIIADKMVANGRARYLPELVKHDLGSAQLLCTKDSRTLRAWNPVVIDWPDDEPLPPIANGNSHEYPCLYERDLKGPVIFTNLDEPTVEPKRTRRVLTNDQVRAIRARRGEAHASIAADYPCSPSTVGQILRGQAYTDVE